MVLRILPSAPLLSVIMVLVFVASAPRASGYVAGVNPFGDWAGTGTAAHNGAGDASQWHDQNAGTGMWLAAGATKLTYTETWTSPKYVRNVYLFSDGRPAGGNVYCSTTLGGPLTTPLTTFSIGTVNTQMWIPVDTTVYGVKVEVNDDKGTGYYQMGEVGFQVENLPADMALGQTAIRSPNYYPDGNANGIIDGRWDDRQYQWRAGETGTDCWAGFVFADGTAKGVGALELYASIQHGEGWGWHNADLQVMQNGVWNSLGKMNSTGTNFYWIDFGGNIQIQGVRLYGSTALGNNPVGTGGGKIIDEIFAFAVPEPAAASLLAMAAASLCARRRTKP